MAELAIRELEKKWAMQMERECMDHMLRELECYNHGFLFVDASKPEWLLLNVSPAAAEEIGAARHPQTLPFCLYGHLRMLLRLI